jgi:tetratricopeptide (TPR) repeat protein
MRVIARCHGELFQWAAALDWARRACSESENTREPWCELAMLMYRQSRWEECFAYSIRTLRIADREKVYTCDPEVWGYKAHDLASISAFHLGLLNVALEHAKKASEMAPDDLRLSVNVVYIQEKMSSS